MIPTLPFNEHVKNYRGYCVSAVLSCEDPYIFKSTVTSKLPTHVDYGEYVALVAVLNCDDPYIFKPVEVDRIFSS